MVWKVNQRGTRVESMISHLFKLSMRERRTVSLTLTPLHVLLYWALRKETCLFDVKVSRTFNCWTCFKPHWTCAWARDALFVFYLLLGILQYFATLFEWQELTNNLNIKHTTLWSSWDILQTMVINLQQWSDRQGIIKSYMLKDSGLRTH